MAANRQQIKIEGVIFVRLAGTDKSGTKHTAPLMVYISSDTNRFYLSREALINLNIISADFPRIGAAKVNAIIENIENTCGCLQRTLPPSRPSSLPFLCTPENNEDMKE